MSITRKLAKLILTLLTLPLLVVVWLLKWFVMFLYCCSAWIFYLLGSVLFATAVLSFVPHAAVAGDGSTSNADRRICDFYDSAGGWQRGCVFGTGGSNDSASMVHIRR